MPKWLTRSPLPTMFAVAAVVAASGAIGLTAATGDRIAEVERIEGLEVVLAEKPVDEVGEPIEVPPTENYLLVGSDSREGITADDPDFGAIGDTSIVSGRRADVIMVLRRELDGGLHLVSLPRDLWLRIPGTGGSNRINSAYRGGPERIVATVTETLGIPINHYVEVNFVGFRDIVNEIGGVEICFAHPARDPKTGLDQQPGCNVLDGIQALAYARSRSYQEFREGEWRTDGRADLGRIERQQLFMRAAADGVVRRLTDQPFSSGELIQSVTASVRVDAALEPFAAAEGLRRSYGNGFTTYSLPVYGDNVDGNSVLRLGDGAEAILEFFRGNTPPPPIE